MRPLHLNPQASSFPPVIFTIKRVINRPAFSIFSRGNHLSLFFFCMSFHAIQSDLNIGNLFDHKIFLQGKICILFSSGTGCSIILLQGHGETVTTTTITTPFGSKSTQYIAVTVSCLPCLRTLDEVTLGMTLLCCQLHSPLAEGSVQTILAAQYNAPVSLFCLFSIPYSHPLLV